MSVNGYQIVEPEVIENWLGVLKNREFLVALLSWLVVRIQNALTTKFPTLHLEVLKIEYQRAYPAIGVRIDNDVPEDIGEQIDALASEFLNTTPLSEFAEFIFNNDIDWTEKTESLLGGVSSFPVPRNNRTS